MDHTRFGRNGREVPRQRLGLNLFDSAGACVAGTREALAGRALALRPAPGEAAAPKARDVPHAMGRFS